MFKPHHKDFFKKVLHRFRFHHENIYEKIIRIALITAFVWTIVSSIIPKMEYRIASIFIAWIIYGILIVIFAKRCKHRKIELILSMFIFSSLFIAAVLIAAIAVVGINLSLEFDTSEMFGPVIYLIGSILVVFIAVFSIGRIIKAFFKKHKHPVKDIIEHLPHPHHEHEKHKK
ncbi:hypothetical protein ACFL56_01320 [Candidatus Margulisiibacteriota bacterium]